MSPANDVAKRIGAYCPGNGSFYVCEGKPNEFVGCCDGFDPCKSEDGLCPDEYFQVASFDGSRYNFTGTQECIDDKDTKIQWYTCKDLNPPFMGCCDTQNPCRTGGCSRSNLRPAKLSTTPKERKFLSLDDGNSDDGGRNDTNDDPNTTNTSPNTGPTNTDNSHNNTGDGQNGNSSGSHDHGTNKSLSGGTVAGIAVGSAAGVVIIIAALFFFWRWRKRHALQQPRHSDSRLSNAATAVPYGSPKPDEPKLVSSYQSSYSPSEIAHGPAQDSRQHKAMSVSPQMSQETWGRHSLHTNPSRHDTPYTYVPSTVSSGNGDHGMDGWRSHPQQSHNMAQELPAQRELAELPEEFSAFNATGRG